MRLPRLGPSDAQVNLVPIDYLVEATIALARNPGANGLTFQVVDPAALQASELYTLMCRMITGRPAADYAISPRLVERLLGLPSLGLVPKVADAETRPHSHMVDNPQSAYAAAVHALYTHLRLADVERPPSTILVTSALPGEGKTSLAASLAAFAVQLGQRTLLVDLDFRRPAVATEFDAEPQADMLAVLAGTVVLEDAILRDPDSGVDLLAAGAGHGNPITLLTSLRLATVLREARERYDCVILDTPPVLGLPDVHALSPAADAILFVVRWDRTTRDAVAAALRQLADVSANLAGVVLNQVDMKKHASYAYGDAAQYYLKYGESYAR